METSGHSDDGAERGPGCLAVGLMAVGVSLGALLLIVGAAILARPMVPPWIRLLPVAAAATVAWTAVSMWWQPRVDRWSAERPPSWRGIVARHFGRPWMLRAGIVLGAAWFGIALLTTP